MGTTNDKLNYLLSTKEAIKAALTGHGVDVTEDDSFRSYAGKLAEMPTMYVADDLPEGAKEGDWCILLTV